MDSLCEPQARLKVVLDLGTLFWDLGPVARLGRSYMWHAKLSALAGSILLFASEAMAQGTAPGGGAGGTAGGTAPGAGAGPATGAAGNGIGNWWWILLVIIVIAAAVWMMRGRRRGQI